MKHRHFILIFLLIVLISVAAMFCLKDNNGEIAEVYSDNQLVHSVDLSTVTDSYELLVDNNGHTNTILIEKDRISVVSADCPDKLCVNQGAIRSSAYPIVCVPNNLYIKIINSSKEDVDAVSR